jgi:hypothetical protein
MVVQRGGAPVRRGLVRSVHGERTSMVSAPCGASQRAREHSPVDRVRKHRAFAVDVDPYLERIRRTIA